MSMEKPSSSNQETEASNINKYIADADKNIEAREDDAAAARRIRVAVEALSYASGNVGGTPEDVEACTEELGIAIGVLIENQTGGAGNDRHEDRYQFSRMADALAVAGDVVGASNAMMIEAAKRRLDWRKYEYVPMGVAEHLS